MKLIADTGLLVAWLNRGDAHHTWARNLITAAEFPILTSEAVLTEAAWHLRNAEKLLELVTADVLRPCLECRQEGAALWALGRRYGDGQPDFCDLSVVRLSELFPQHEVATVDRGDFTVYRSFGDEIIPFVCPE